MTSKTKPFDYISWLSGLKAGETVKIRGGKYTVAGVTDKAVIVQYKDNMVHYSKENGREFGSKSGSYKESSLVPYTEADKEAEKLEESRQKEGDEKRALAKQVVSLAIGAGNYCNQTDTIANRFSKTDLNKMIAFLEKLKPIKS
jgi:hypothetical protein